MSFLDDKRIVEKHCAPPFYRIRTFEFLASAAAAAVVIAQCFECVDFIAPQLNFLSMTSTTAEQSRINTHISFFGGRKRAYHISQKKNTHSSHLHTFQNTFGIHEIFDR